MNKYSRSIVAENINALKGQQENNRQMLGHKRLCWKCQKDKPMVKGIGLTFMGNLARFICLDCTQAKLKEKNFD